MLLLSSEIESIKCKAVNVPGFNNSFISLLRFFIKIPAIKRYIENVQNDLAHRISQSWEEKDYENTTKMVILALEKYRYKINGLHPIMEHHEWWEYMELGVDSAQLCGNSGLKAELIDCGARGIMPLQGHFVAYAFLGFSRWKYEFQEYEEAIRYAEIASDADLSWADPDYLLGWYSLIFGNYNAERYLERAIEKDQRVLFRIATDPVCKQYPHIINKLKRKYTPVRSRCRSCVVIEN